MVLKFHNEFFVRDYDEVYQMYLREEFATANSQTIPEGIPKDTIGNDAEKISKLLQTDENNIYVVSKVNGVYFIGMVELSISITLNSDLKENSIIYTQFGEDINDEEFCHAEDVDENIFIPNNERFYKIQIS